MLKPALWSRCLIPFALCAALVACGDDSTDETAGQEPFTLRFAATADGASVGCMTPVSDVGPAQAHTLGVSDLRFYVSNLRLLDAEGNALSFTLDESPFQYTSDAGAVALIDLTGNTEGTCAGNAIAFAEGTARTNFVITGKAPVQLVKAVHFDVGLPQPLMRETIATTSAEAAPSPLNEMFWSWASGYRHLVFNFTVTDAEGSAGEGYLHVGSRDCGPPDGLALSDREACDFVNTPRVALDGFDLAADTVQLDLAKLTQGVDLIAPVYDLETFEVIGEGPGVECHSSPMQPDCAFVFGNLGLDMETGDASAESNDVFSILKP